MLQSRKSCSSLLNAGAPVRGASGGEAAFKIHRIRASLFGSPTLLACQAAYAQVLGFRLFRARRFRPGPPLPTALSHRLRRGYGRFDMTHGDPNKRVPDKYGGMVEFDMALTPSVIICGVAGAVLGAILALWGTTEVPIIIAKPSSLPCFRASSASSCLGISRGDTRTPESFSCLLVAS